MTVIKSQREEKQFNSRGLNRTRLSILTIFRTVIIMIRFPSIHPPTKIWPRPSSPHSRFPRAGSVWNDKCYSNVGMRFHQYAYDERLPSRSLIVSKRKSKKKIEKNVKCHFDRGFDTPFASCRRVRESETCHSYWFFFVPRVAGFRYGITHRHTIEQDPKPGWQSQ